jgi:hypothetical protein
LAAKLPGYYAFYYASLPLGTGRLMAHAFCVPRVILMGCVIFTHARVIFTPGTKTGGT